MTNVRTLEGDGVIVENIVEALGGLQLTVRQLAEGVECTGIHSSYVTGVTSVCSNCLTGIVIMMGISAAIAIAFRVDILIAIGLLFHCYGWSGLCMSEGQLSMHCQCQTTRLRPS